MSISIELNPLNETSFAHLTADRVGNREGIIEIIKKDLFFELSLNQDLYFTGAIPPIKRLVFKNCRFAEKVGIGPYHKAGDVTFKDCVFSKSVHLASLDNITFMGTNILEDNLEIYTGDQNITIENIHIKRFLIIHGKGNLDLRNINDGVEELQGEIDLKSDFAIVVFENVRAVSLVTKYKAAIDELRINKCTFKRLDILSVRFERLLSITASHLDQLLLHEPQQSSSVLEIKSRWFIKLFTYHLASFGTLLCQASDFDGFELFGENKDDNTVKLEIVTIKNLVFGDVRNKGLISFNQVDIIKGGSLTMKASDFGKANFILCEFSAASFEFLNSKIMDAFMAETNFPRHVFRGNQPNFIQEQLAFGQISTAYQKQGDTVRSLEYQAREIEAHYKVLKWFPKGIKSFSFTKFSLWLNRWSNDFGRNWARGLLFSFGLGIGLYYLVVISSTEFHIGWPSIDGRLVSSFFKFMNPLRFFETENLFKTVNDKPYLTLKPVSYFLDFVARILIAYGYYQTIQAFRRYGRKS